MSKVESNIVLVKWFKVIDGPFNTFEGEVRNVEGDKVDVDVKVFGRPTKVSLTIEQIQKV
jgi:transcription antitermination factor NusG